MRIRFLIDQTTREAVPKHFAAGSEHTLAAASCYHWINLGVAVEVPDTEATARKSADRADPPGGTADRSHAEHQPGEHQAARETGAESAGATGGFAVSESQTAGLTPRSRGSAKAT